MEDMRIELKDITVRAITFSALERLAEKNGRTVEEQVEWIIENLAWVKEAE